MEEPQPEQRPFTVWLSNELRTQLDYYAEREGRKTANFVRLLLTKYIEDKRTEHATIATTIQQR